MKSIKVLWMAIMALVINVGVAQDLDEVLASHFEAVNQEVLSHSTSMHMVGKSGRMGQEFGFEMWQKRPKMMRMEADVQGQKMIQVYDGEKGYLVAPWTGSLEPQEMGLEQMEQMEQQSDMDGDLWNWKEKGSQLTFEGSEDFEGSEVYVLELIRKNGDEEKIFIDADSYLIIKQVSKTMVQGAEMSMETYMSNYKEANGVVMPYYIETRMGGQIVSTVTLEKVEFDPELDDHLFEKPESPKKQE